MAYYCVNKNAQPNGTHEVHKDGCNWYPEEKNRVDLGTHSSCKLALEEAQEYFGNVNGCAYCCPTCHRS